MDYSNIIGQLLGMGAVVLGFLNYQVKGAKSILLIQLITCAVFCAHYLMIGAISAFALNVVGVVRNIVYYKRNSETLWGKICPVVFAVVMGVMGMLSWQNWYSAFVVAGLVINTVCLGFKSAHDIRKSILVSSPMVLYYDIMAKSIGGVVYESVAIISAIIGLVRHKKHSI